jgi:hypothetical protein
MSIKASLFAAFVVATGQLASTSNAAVPVLPGAAGFGVNTPAGRGGVVYRVTNLSNGGAGSLAACVSALGPRVCIFEVSGTIVLTDDFEIRNPNITIAGQTAPSPGIMLRGGGLLISASDVLVQHIRVRVGDDANGPAPDNRDALKIEAPMARSISNVVVDHCSFSWSIDEMASVWEGAHEVSLLNNIFAEPLNDSSHPADGGGTEPHGYGVIFGPADGNVGNISMVGNLLAHHVARAPLAYSSFAMVNNVVYNRGDSDVDISNRGVTTDAAIVGNVFLRGKDYTPNMPPVKVRGATSDATAVRAGTRIFLADNLAQETNSDPWSVAWVEPPVSKSGLQAASAPLWPTGLIAMPTANSTVLSSVLARVGARAADRDAVDTRIVAGVRTRTGQIINCVAADGSARCAKNGGGWPVLAQRTRALTLPASPNLIGSDGYSNLERWLHTMAAEVEGRISAPAAPVNTQVQ